MISKMTKEEAEKLYSRVIHMLQNAGASTRCDDVINVLESLGFVVRGCKQGGHKVYRHPGIQEFQGSNFNCGHGKNPEIKPAYIRKILRILDDYGYEIKQYMEKMKP